MAYPPKGKSIERLQGALNTIAELKQLPRFSPKFETWRRNTEVAISNTFRDQPRYTEDFTKIQYSLIVWSTGTPDSADQQAYIEGLDSAAAMLESMIDEIKEYWDEGDQTISTQGSVAIEAVLTNKVFVVHGKDEGTKETVARLLTKLGLEPVVLHEQPNHGRTIVEKFEQYSNVSFAVVLLTPDDFCHSGDPEDSQPRARQNVILELGFFLGKLGRNRTCILRKDNVEIPSDYDGVLYTPIDGQGAWKMELVRELKDAGIEVDANLAL